MTDREKQISEMAEVLEKAKINARETLGSMNRGFGMWYAAALYNVGYRKMDEITLKLDLGDRPVEEIAGLVGALEAARTDNDNLTRTLEEASDELEEIHKETAQKILSYLYEKMGNSALSDTELVKTLAEEYGVEVEE